MKIDHNPFEKRTGLIFLFFERVACVTSIAKQSHKALQRQTRGTKRHLHPKPEPSLT
jgi:hypothetical protein